MTYFKVRVDVFGNNVFGFGFILTVDDVHVQLALVTFEQWTQFGHIFATFFDGLQEHTKRNVVHRINLADSFNYSN